MNEDYYKLIKEELISNEVYKKTKDYYKNIHDLQTYYNVGKLLFDAQGGEQRAKYGDRLIKEYSEKLTLELGSGYSTRSLKRMRKFYIYIKKGTALLPQLSWSHYLELLKLKDINIINYYIDLAVNLNLSYRELGKRIKAKDYERLDDKTKIKIVNKEPTILNDLIKNPIQIKNVSKVDYDKVSELVLKNMIVEQIKDFMSELGRGYAFIGDEYKIKIGNNYIDLLLFNYVYNAFVVIELKVVELTKEHFGQIQTYMNYIDKNIKQINQNQTIRIIIVKKDNRVLLKYSSDPRIETREFELI